MQERISRHNVGWAPERYDFGEYLRASWGRYFRAYRSLMEASGNPSRLRFCDVGAFWGVFPLTLQRLGHDTTVTEAMRFFGDGFTNLFGLLSSEGVRVEDYDPFTQSPEQLGVFDAVSVMAVLEHYPHSLKTFMRNVLRLLAAEGSIYIEVPNLAYWPRRMKLLRGESPLSPLQHIWDSDEPFTGHHHEFTLDELHQLAEWTGLKIIEEQAFNYSLLTIKWRDLLGPRERWPLTMREVPGRLVQWAAFRRSPQTREILAITCCQGESGTVDKNDEIAGDPSVHAEHPEPPPHSDDDRLA